jgi:biofilm PGA synthesis N-glycosyltransferase PgaC
MMEWLPAIFIIPYIIVLLKIYISLKRIKPFIPSSLPSIPVAVIIPCRNEEKSLSALLNDLSEQDYPDDLYEVIVIDDNSSDNTFKLASNYTHIKDIKVIRNNGSGKKEAVRCGIDRASAELIITTDADCRAGRKWISTVASFYQQVQADFIIGPVRITGGKGFPGRFQELEFMGLQGVTAGTAHEGNATMCNGANMAFTREVYFKNAHNLHPEIPSGDDIFLLHSVKQQPGSRICWIESPEAMITTGAEVSVRSLAKQRSRWLAKSSAYKDIPTILLGVTTIIPALLILSLLAASFSDIAYLPVISAVIMAKSVPDFLILKTITAKYGEPRLMKWFVPVQLVYPFYVAGVTAIALVKGKYR